jgi:AraC-like DNA-binding protein
LNVFWRPWRLGGSIEGGRLLGEPTADLGVELTRGAAADDGADVAAGHRKDGGVAAAGELAERLYEAPGWGARLDLLERAIARRVLAAPPLPAALEWGWRRLLESDGAVPIGALAEELGWSRRHLAATFREQLGLPPKTIARLLRFERAAERLRRQDPVDLGRLALDCGYYDHAHLDRDFREFSGATPSEYRRVTSVQDVAALAA